MPQGIDMSFTQSNLRRNSESRAQDSPRQGTSSLEEIFKQVEENNVTEKVSYFSEKKKIRSLVHK